jgi:hypothetical protein
MIKGGEVSRFMYEHPFAVDMLGLQLETSPARSPAE